jgi:hypothetical protein
MTDRDNTSDLAEDHLLLVLLHGQGYSTQQVVE